MIKQYPVFVNKKKKLYYWHGKCVCEMCNASIPYLDVVIIFSSWSKKNSFNKSLCLSCFGKHKYLTQEVTEFKIANIVENIPPNSFPIIVQPPILINGDKDRTVFDVANEQIGDEQVIDNTRLAGRESLEGAQIGLSPDKVALNNNVLDDNELDNFLLDTKNSVPVLPDNNKKRLADESKRGE